MRTRFIIILTLCLALCLAAVSCNADSALLKEETLVSVSFDNGGSRSLSASLENFDTENYYWYYKATKVDGSKFKSGETSGFVAVQAGKGLSANNQKVRISGFSQGLWTFELEAYTDGNKLVYKGKTENVPLRNSSTNGDGSNTVNVIVSSVNNAGNGTLTVEVDAIKAASSYTQTITSVDLFYSVVGSETWVDEENVSGKYSKSLAPGAYIVRLTFNFAGGGHTTSSVVATVYSNLTTTIGGNMTSAVSGS